MSTGTIILLGAFAGLTIYLGLPLAFFKGAPQGFKVFASMLATGILVFLFYDVIAKASEPIDDAIAALQETSSGGGELVGDVLLLMVGIIVGLLGLVYFNRYIVARYKPRHQQTPPLVLPSEAAVAGATREPVKSPAAAPASETTPRALALMIALGIGLHNFSEGLAIGQSAATGALALATILIIGFGLHNMTEGFGIAGPLAKERVSWRFIALLGLIGGGPTFLGTVVGIVYHSPQVFILFLALAAGSILYVIVELLAMAKRSASMEIIMWGLALGFFLGYLTDLIVSYAGA